MILQFKYPLVLASQSPRRQQLLRDLGLTFEVMVRPTPEYVPEDMEARAVAVFIAENKAKAFSDIASNHIIVTADTLVVLDKTILGKPADEAQATEMLNLLSGRPHQVITGVSIYHAGNLKSFAEETIVNMRELRPQEIRYYIAQYKPYDKAGAYGIQEWIGMIGIGSIQGDYYNVMGLPTARLYQELLNLAI